MRRTLRLKIEFAGALAHTSAMPPSLDHLPRVSFIMPTLNAEALLDNVLASIARQTYPREKMEIILADAHSTDATRDIAKKFGALVLDDDGKNMEEGKRLALRHATGDYIVFVDADNEITHADYIELAVKALAANPQALGVESYYLPSPKMTSFCAYITALLHISDPIAWLMSANPKLGARDGETERWVLPENSFAYPLGANGFVFRRADLESVKAGEKFQDTHVALFLMKNGKREWLRILGRGVHHYRTGRGANFASRSSRRSHKEGSGYREGCVIPGRNVASGAPHSLLWQQNGRLRLSKPPGALQQPEVPLDIRHHHCRLAVQRSRLELPAAHRFHGALVQSEPQVLPYRNVLRLATGVDLDPQHHRPLQLGFACFLGILRIGLPQQHRRRQHTARRSVVGDAVDSLARSQARALAVADAVTLASPDAAALTRAARSRPVHAAGRAPPRIVQRGDLDIGIAHQRRLHQQDRSNILDLHHGWRELVRGEAGHRADACRQGVARPTASSPSHLVRRDGTVLAEVRGE